MNIRMSWRVRGFCCLSKEILLLGLKCRLADPERSDPISEKLEKRAMDAFPHLKLELEVPSCESTSSCGVTKFFSLF